MATIQIKRSSGTNAPASLAHGELAWLDASDKLFVGDAFSVPKPIAGDGRFLERLGFTIPKEKTLTSLLLARDLAQARVANGTAPGHIYWPYGGQLSITQDVVIPAGVSFSTPTSSGNDDQYGTNTFNAEFVVDYAGYGLIVDTGYSDACHIQNLRIKQGAGNLGLAGLWLKHGNGHIVERVKVRGAFPVGYLIGNTGADSSFWLYFNDCTSMLAQEAYVLKGGFVGTVVLRGGRCQGAGQGVSGKFGFRSEAVGQNNPGGPLGDTIEIRGTDFGEFDTAVMVRNPGSLIAPRIEGCTTGIDVRARDVSLSGARIVGATNGITLVNSSDTETEGLDISSVYFGAVTNPIVYPASYSKEGLTIVRKGEINAGHSTIHTSEYGPIMSSVTPDSGSVIGANGFIANNLKPYSSTEYRQREWSGSSGLFFGNGWMDVYTIGGPGASPAVLTASTVAGGRRMRVHSNGNVTINTTTDNYSAPLQVNGNICPSVSNNNELGTANYRWNRLYANNLHVGAATILSGNNTPEGAVTAAVGSLFLRLNGGANTTLYVKQSGTGNTGWVAK